MWVFFKVSFEVFLNSCIKKLRIKKRKVLNQLLKKWPDGANGKIEIIKAVSKKIDLIFFLFLNISFKNIFIAPKKKIK